PEHLRCVGETEFVNGVAAMSASGIYGPSRACAAIVGTADCRRGEAVEEGLLAQLRAGDGRWPGTPPAHAADAHPPALPPKPRPVLGPVHRPERAELLMNADFRRGFSRRAPLGLSFAAWLLEPQLPELIDLARAFPDTEIVLDYVGTPLGIGSYKLADRFGV